MTTGIPCPKCNSPRARLLPNISSPTYHCQDCNSNFQPSIWDRQLAGGAGEQRAPSPEPPGQREPAGGAARIARRNQPAKEYMLELTNQERARYAAPPLSLGTNPAAQLHAEISLAGGYLSHWDQYGLKPNHRYALAGGRGACGENVAAEFQSGTERDLMQTVQRAVQGWTESPGHHRQLVDPTHTELNAGIASQEADCRLVQLFESNHLTTTQPAAISTDGTLSLQAHARSASLNIRRFGATNVTITYHRPPAPLGTGQLCRTATCTPDELVASVQPPLPPGYQYRGPATQEAELETHGIDPYDIDPGTRPPKNFQEAARLHRQAQLESEIPRRLVYHVANIIAARLEIQEYQITLEADLSTLLAQRGPGIYEVILWGKPDHMARPVPVTQQCILWRTDLPDNCIYQKIQGEAEGK